MPAISGKKLSDLYRQAMGIGENALSMITSGLAEPAAGYAAAAAAATGYDAEGARNAIRERMTYAPKTAEGVRYLSELARVMSAVNNSAPVTTWKKGVDIAGRYSPAAGAVLATVPTAIGVATGAKPAMQQGRSISMLAQRMQDGMVNNAMAPRKLHPQAGVFAGISAFGADLKALGKAQKMMEDGISPEQIWEETGWLKADDGKWRYEIPDAGATFKKKENGRLSDVLSHDALFKAYPQLRDIDVDFDAQGIAGAHYSTDEGRKISLNNQFNEGVLLHEIQHEIQDLEGFSPGGSPGEKTVYEIKGRQYAGEQAYKRLLGEIEAGLVQERYHKFGINDKDLLREYYPYEKNPYAQNIPYPIIVKERK